MAEPVQKPTAAPKPAAKTEDDFVLFISANPEPYSFLVMGIRGMRYQKDTNRLSWRVPKRDIERFKRHHFCTHGRVIPEKV